MGDMQYWKVRFLLIKNLPVDLLVSIKFVHAHYRSTGPLKVSGFLFSFPVSSSSLQLKQGDNVVVTICKLGLANQMIQLSAILFLAAVLSHNHDGHHQQDNSTQYSCDDRDRCDAWIRAARVFRFIFARAIFAVVLLKKKKRTFRLR